MSQEEAKGYTRLLYAIFGEKTDWDHTKIASSELIDQINSVLATLSNTEERFIKRRFGMEDGEPQLLADLAVFLETSVEDAGEFEAEAMRKLRHPARSQPLRAFLD